MNSASKRPPESARVGNSIARRLSSRLFFRLFGIFLSLDIMICVLTGISLTIYSEQTASSAAKLLGKPGTSYVTGDFPAISGVTFEVLTQEPDGLRVMKPFFYLLPVETGSSLRNVELTGAAGAPFYRKLDTLQYNVFLQEGVFTYKISVALGRFLHFFRYAFAALLVYEFLILLSRLAKDRRMIARTLKPISALAETANSLRAESQFDPNKMAAIAFKLEGINASRLDTRIQVDETQDELKNLAAAINGMLDRINESYRAQVRFVSDASHELRTPISVIQGYANLLDRWGKNDEKTLQESITAIKDEAANMKELVEHLLFLARGDNNTIRLQLEEVPLSELAGEVVHEMRMIDMTHHFEVRAAEIGVTADRSLLKQALRILVDNAIKYTDAGGNITVSTEGEGDFARLSVTDDGIGISPEIVPQIFDRFYRADESRARATGGAGLGLSIAKWIATRHGGHMEVLSRVGIGTKVMIALPTAGISADPAALQAQDNKSEGEKN